MPFSPSTTTSRQSLAVAATIAIRLARAELAEALHISDKTRVFPNPRPASKSQIVQSPSGGSWFGRAITSQPVSSADARPVANELTLTPPRVAPAVLRSTARYRRPAGAAPPPRPHAPRDMAATRHRAPQSPRCIVGL